MKKLILVVLVLVIAVAIGLWLRGTPGADPRFAEEALDFARLEHEYPMSMDERAALTPARLAESSQEPVDQLYAPLTAGPLPDGPYDGDLFFPRGTDSETRLGEIIGGPVRSRLANLGVRRTEGLGRMLWKGKMFYRDERLLRN